MLSYYGLPSSGRASDRVIFIHGHGADHSMWVPMCRHFTRKRLAPVAIALPGRRGRPLATDNDLRSWSVAVATCMEEVGTRRAVLVGHGLGVGIAAAVQAMSPQVAGIVALGLPSLEHPLSSFAADLECSPDRALDGIVNTGLLPVLEGNLTAGVAWRGSRRCLLRCLERTTLRADLMVALQARDHLESLQSLAVPWCLMYGQGDAGLSALVRHLVPLVPADWVVSFDTPGASLLLDRGNDVLQTMSQFARECLEQGAPT